MKFLIRTYFELVEDSSLGQESILSIEIAEEILFVAYKIHRALTATDTLLGAPGNGLGHL